MDNYVRAGFSFGLTSAIITTLGMMVGLYSSTQSQLAVAGSIITIAVADAFSDAIGMHIAKESQDRYTSKSVWESTISTFLFKFLFPLLFVIPVILLDLQTAIIISVAIGLFVLALLSYILALHHKINPLKSVAGHLFVAVIVILATSVLGSLIAGYFNS